MILKEPASEGFSAGASAIRLSTGPIRWLADPSFAPLLPALFPDPEKFSDPPASAEIIKNGARRAVFAAPVDGFEGRVLVKVHRPMSIWDRLRDLFLRPQALHEFEVARALSRASVRVAPPLAAGRVVSGGLPAGSVLVTRFIDGARTVMDLLKSGAADRELVDGTAACFAALHRAGFYHPDMHLGNVLATRSGGALDILLIDLHSVPLGRGAGRSNFVENLAHARNSFVDGHPRLFARFVAEYARARELSRAEGRELARDAWDRADILLRSFWARRTARCLKDSSGFTVSRAGGARVFAAVEFGAVAALEIVESYSSGAGRLIKDGGKTRLAAGLEAAGAKVVVKEYRGGGLAAALSVFAGAGRARRAWVGGNGLLIRKVGAARPLALVERASGPSFVVMEDMSGAPELDRHLTRPEGSAPSSLKRTASDLGGFVGSLHRKGVFHADLKTCNIVVTEFSDAGTRFALLDHDRVSFCHPVPPRLKTRNLAQLNTSIPSSVPLSVRLRFLRAYVRACPFQGGMAALAARVLLASAGRDIVYVTDHGDVIERRGG